MCSKLKKQEASAGSDKLVLLWRVVKASSGKPNTPDLLVCLDKVEKVEKVEKFKGIFSTIQITLVLCGWEEVKFLAVLGMECICEAAL